MQEPPEPMIVTHTDRTVTMQEPPEPMIVSLAGLYKPADKHAVVADRISDHIFECQALLDDIKYGETIRPCEDIICCYFRWFYPRHYNQCNFACFQNGKQESDCVSCNKLRAWISLHSTSCKVKCPILPCQNQYKRDQLKKRLTDPHIGSYHFQPPTPSKRNANTLPNLRPSSSGMPHPSNYGVENNPYSRDSFDWTQGRPDRHDSIASTISIGSTCAPYRSNISDQQLAVEYEAPVKPPLLQFQANTSLNRQSIDSMAQSFSAMKQQPGLNHRSDTIAEFSSSEDDVEDIPNELISRTQPEATLPITSLPQGDSKNSETPPVGLYYHPIQRQHTQTDLKKAVFPGPNGRQSISFTVSRSPDMIPESHDSHATEQSPQSPRQSSFLSAKRKRELTQQQRVISDSPEINRRPQTSNVENRVMSPDDGHFSSLNSEDQEFTILENKTRRRPGKRSQASSNREVWSPSSDSSPSSLEETPQKGRRSRVVQRMDTDPGDEHTKILTGSGSITAAHAKLIQEFNTGRDMVKLRTKKLSDPESGDRTSGVSSASVSTSSVGSARSSGTGIFSELDEHLSSLEGPVHHDILEGPLSSNYNHENDDSASTVVGDQSLSSGTTHPMDSYQRQLSNNSSASYNYHSDQSNSGPQSLAVSGYDHQPRYVSPGYSHEAHHPQGSHSYNLHPSHLPHGSHSSYNLHSSHPPQGSQWNYDSHQAATAYSPDAYQRTSHQNSLYETAIHSPRSNIVSSAYPHTIPYHEDSTAEDVPEVNLYAIAAQRVPEVCPYAIAAYSSSDENDSDSESETKSLPSPPSFHPSLLIEESVRGVDEALAKYDRDIHIMNHRPQRGGKVPTHKQSGMSEEEKYQMQPVTHPVDKDSDYFPIPSNFLRPDPEMIAKQHEMYQEMLSQRLPDTPQEDEIIQRSIMARRDQLKQYLLGQFYSDEVYREHTDWERKTKLGHGAQASCFSVCDNKTQCILVLKEETENRRTLDEAYLSLKFASQSNPSPNIVEYYTAALLPGDLVFPKRASPFVQIFMEQMPVCMQGWLFKTGPIPLINVHHYACQLFDALDFLHNKQGIIHCDIKPANILVDETAQRIKLTDFGSAEIIGEKRINYSKTFSADPNAGTLSYNPPEFYREQQCSFAFDVWQAGCCVLAMCTGRRPWRHLFMDVYPGKQSDQLTIAMKRNHKLMIQQQRGGHLHPAFLDPTLKRLLHGCLHDNPSSRLTAKECSYLLNTETASTEEDRRKILEAIGYTPNTPAVLQSFSPDQYRVDVYLGSDKLTSISLGHTQKGGPVHLALYGGWLGSLAVPQGMTYREAEEEIHRRFPVARQLSPFILASYDNAPHTIWSACSGGDQVPPYRHTRPDSLVDLNTAIVLSPSTMV
ncbi:uncharacterized protein LOC135334528 isoform X2 [Halichondria panicea]|uniref:uncharacterized protein LOC135334528 isoform X2 n=1 Tax=Halichondria panicea TaxID=6063 RepID=UPI00312B9896